MVVTSIRLGGRNRKTYEGKNRETYDKIQLKNKWDNMKKDRNLYDRLMRLETGIGGTRSLIDAWPEWWEEKINVCFTILFNYFML